MYQALYRKWRPSVFDDVVGQERITETLKNQIKTGKLSHAYLFIGTRGTGKTTCAKILAKAVNCENPQNGNPCNKCRSCLGINSGEIMDVVELDAASNNGVENVRALRDEAVFSPASVKKRVYIVDEVHMLSTSAFNALLKILEEPPEHLMFILATTELNKVPATILSRCQRYSFRRLEPEAIADRLMHVAQKEGLDLRPDAAALLSHLADGAMRDGLSLLDQCSGYGVIDADCVRETMGLAGSMMTAELLKAVTGHNTAEALDIFARLWQGGKDPASLLEELAELMRDALMTKVAGSGASSLLSGTYEGETVKGFAQSMTSSELLFGLDIIQETQAKLRQSQDPRLSAELCIISMCEPELNSGMDALRARVARLESGAPINVTAEPVHETRVPAQHENQREKEKPEPVWAPEPAKTAEPELQEEEVSVKEEPEPAAREQAGGAELWNKLLERLNAPASFGIYNLLSDHTHAEGRFEGNVLSIDIKDAFTYGVISRPASQDRIRENASAICGGPVKLEIRQAENGGQPKADLGALSRFGNVKFND